VQGIVADGVGFIGDHLGGQWLSRHSGVSCLEFDTDEEEEKSGIIGVGEGIQ
jgi:hypothetical protein